MAFHVPDFNLTCNIFDNDGSGIYPTVRISPNCNLSPGKRTMQFCDFSPGGQPLVGGQGFFFSSNLLLPKQTDLHTLLNGYAFPDLIEVPASSGRFYGLTWWEDVGKGFSNEYRLAIICQIGSKFSANSAVWLGIPDWPQPTP